ncbi:uncharacterized protein LOC130801522 [Amaranthus tricolor]|uniref:uncharacterized protein LOC130801522 n=1 Tax=Amaranthus tricolor TaxID=29722 RepID=UPI00258B9CEB|nr:uncharacterized protein LOC130801522 [Amaranthus tricolor]
MTMSIQGSRRHHPSVGRSGEKSRLAHSDLVTDSRKRAVKSTGNMGQTRVSAVHIEKPPIRASTRYGLGLTSSIETGLHSSRSVDFKPCRTFADKVGTNLLKSFEMEGITQNSGLKAAYSQDSCSLTPEHHQKNNSQTAPRKDSTKETKFSPVSSKISSLRTPSQHIGFFDMKQQKSEKARYEKDGNKHSNKGQRKTELQTQSLDLEEKENVVDPEGTVIEVRMKKAQLGANGSSSQKSLLRTQRSKRQTMLSPAKSKTPSSAKGSVLKRSAFF